MNKTLIFMALMTFFSLTFAGKQADELIKMASSNVGDEVMIAYIASLTPGFTVSPDDIVAMKNSGISDSVIAKVIRQGSASSGAKNINTAAGSEGKTPLPASSVKQTEETEQPPDRDVDLDDFETQLTPYGAWIIIDGVRYWRPSIALTMHGWKPYCHGGHWVWTDWGWTWVSHYPWGWAPFHYGRWIHHPRYGWVWIPDYEWGPAWVCWRYSDDYFGWAPLPPSVKKIHHDHVTFDFEVTVGMNDFIFVNSGHFCEHEIHKHIIPHAQTVMFFPNTVVIKNNFTHVNNHLFVNGLPVNLVMKKTNKQIRPVTLMTGIGKQGKNGFLPRQTPDKLVLFKPPLHAKKGPLQQQHPPLLFKNKIQNNETGKDFTPFHTNDNQQPFLKHEKPPFL